MHYSIWHNWEFKSQNNKTVKSWHDWQTHRQLLLQKTALKGIFERDFKAIEPQTVLVSRLWLCPLTKWAAGQRVRVLVCWSQQDHSPLIFLTVALPQRTVLISGRILFTLPLAYWKLMEKFHLVWVWREWWRFRAFTMICGQPVLSPITNCIIPRVQ